MNKNQTAYCLSWPDAFDAGAGLCGGKGHQLARLHRYGFNVPRGGVLSIDAYRAFLDANRLNAEIDVYRRALTEESIDVHSHLLTRLRDNILQGSVPAPIVKKLSEFLCRQNLDGRALAVRSSGATEDSVTASFAGIHESYLNIIGLENILQAVKQCYASLWTPQTLAYRRRLGISDTGMLAAVVLMEMVDAKAAGVSFTCDPATGREDRFIINANFGLGDSVVSGLVDPDIYELEVEVYRALPRLVRRKTGNKQGTTQPLTTGGVAFQSSDTRDEAQVLTDREIENLGLQLLRILESLGEGSLPQDVEWAFDGKDFFILQSRPVTVLPRYTLAQLKDKQDIWSNGNFREALPMVLSPLHRRFMRNLIDTVQTGYFTEIDYPVPEGFSFSRFFGGRLYCNISALQWAHYDATGVSPDGFTSLWGGHQPTITIDETNPFEGKIGLDRQQRGVKSQSLIMEAAVDAQEAFSKMERDIRQWNKKDFSQLPDSNFTEAYNQLGRLMKPYARRFTFFGGIGTYRIYILMQILSAYLGGKTSAVLSALLVGGEANIPSADHGYRLVELAHTARNDEWARSYFGSEDYDPHFWNDRLPDCSSFKNAFAEYLDMYGSRAVYELDIINPRWNEDPSYLLDIIRGSMFEVDSGAWKTKQQKIFDEAWCEIKEKVPPEMIDGILRDIRQVQEGMAVREMNKSILARALEPYRLLALSAGRRFAARDMTDEAQDIFFCTWSDIFSILAGEWDGSGLRDLLEDRKSTFRDQELNRPPDVIEGDTPVYSRPAIEPSGRFLSGVGAAAGIATGTARLIHHPAEGNRLRQGDVLVAPSTDPGWTPLFIKAAAIIMETGGYLSHGSIIAREFGVPAVVNVPGVMRAICEGQTVYVDGNTGKIGL